MPRTTKVSAAEIKALIDQGLTYAEIKQRLGVGSDTIKKAKLGIVPKSEPEPEPEPEPTYFKFGIPGVMPQSLINDMIDLIPIIEDASTSHAFCNARRQKLKKHLQLLKKAVGWKK